jgi:hypothetical protein
MIVETKLAMSEAGIRLLTRSKNFCLQFQMLLLPLSAANWFLPSKASTEKQNGGSCAEAFGTLCVPSCWKAPTLVTCSYIERHAASSVYGGHVWVEFSERLSCLRSSCEHSNFERGRFNLLPRQSAANGARMFAWSRPSISLSRC